MSAWSGPWHALLLATVSSADNFAVGCSLGMLKLSLHSSLNLTIAVCNGLGAALSTGIGATLGSSAPGAAGLLAATIFFYLAVSFYNDEKSPLTSLAAKGAALRLALPMTLNNVAGGVAGGLAGDSALQMGISASITSFTLMLVGHRFGHIAASNPTFRAYLDPRKGSAAIFISLGLVQMVQLINDMQSSSTPSSTTASSPHASTMQWIIPDT